MARDIGATSTFEEIVEARRLFGDLTKDQFWNPWRMEEDAESLERAMQVMAEWERADPGFRRMTSRQLHVWMARQDRQFRREQERRDQRRELNQGRFDP